MYSTIFWHFISNPYMLDFIITIVIIITTNKKLIHFAVHLKLTQHCKSTILQ